MLEANIDLGGEVSSDFCAVKNEAIFTLCVISGGGGARYAMAELNESTLPVPALQRFQWNVIFQI